MIKRPLISVCTITYGHEKYITKCIEGVLMQEGDFEIEYIIASDKSPDETHLIVEDYIRNHPKGHCIKFINRTENIGIMPNFYETLKMATGDYIALCDGDDYWTDAQKLKKQLVCFNDQDTILVGHNVRIFDNTDLSTIQSSFPFQEKIKIEKKLIYNRNYIPALSILFKNNNQIPVWLLECEIGDYPLILYLSQFGEIKFIFDNMADYRMFSGYHSSKKTEEKNSMLSRALKTALLHLNHLSEANKKSIRSQIIRLDISQKIPLDKKLKMVLASDITIPYKLKLMYLCFQN